MEKFTPVNRRDFLAASAAGAVGGANLVSAAQAQGAATIPPPPVLDPNAPLAKFWEKPVYELAGVDLGASVPELSSEAVRERHRIYCLLLMALMVRFWNGNKHGPVGTYPYRDDQKLPGQASGSPSFRYRGDAVPGGFDRNRVEWDRYLGHNIACIGVDGNGDIIDFDFNHNEVYRSSVEHAEARLVRRLFSLADIFDSWNTGQPLPGKSKAFSLREVTLYTSLESCAQCSGIMSLGGVKQIVYLQNDPGTYVVGNLMYKLARDSNNQPLAPAPIPGSAIDLPYFAQLNSEYAAFYKKILDAKQNTDKSQSFYFRPDGSNPDYSPSITSFLCTDTAFSIFDAGRSAFESLKLKYPTDQYPGVSTSLTNERCLTEAKAFFDYASFEGYRGSPHKL